jgi:NADH:ubiquinone oxidoreductase subunit E
MSLSSFLWMTTCRKAFLLKSLMTRIELCMEGLEPNVREGILEAIYSELRISPGEVSSDGNFELELLQCGEDTKDAPYLRIDGLLFARVTVEKTKELVRGRKRGAI